MSDKTGRAEAPRPKKKKLNLRIMMSLFVFLIMVVSMLFIGAVTAVLFQLGIYDPFHGSRNPLVPLAGLLAFSVLTGTVLTALMGNRTLKPLRKVIDATRRVAAGDFSVRLEVGSIPEMDDLNRSFNTMVEELGSIETLRSDFVSNFSHEFKTPIVSIRGFAKLLRDPDLPEAERAEYTEIIIRESERLVGLSQSALNLSKLEHIGILTGKGHFFLDEQVRRVAAMMEPRWKEKGVAVELRLDSITIHSDEDLLQQVWMNLLDNALKFTGAGGHINLSLRRQGENAVFTIEDDGCGMDAATTARVFDKFYQGDKSHSGAGNGLGLPLVQKAVALCGGTVAVESAPGQGSRFTVVLPVGPASGA